MFLFVIISFLLYIIAPTAYSHMFCVICLVVGLINAICLYKGDLENEKIGFNAFFTIIFFPMFFIYPVFVRPILPDFSFFAFGYNEQIINKCAALAILFYSIYSASYRIGSKKSKSLRFKKTSIDEVITSRTIKISIFLDVIVFVLFLLSGGISFFRNQFTHEGSNASVITTYLYVLLQQCNFLLTLSFLLKNNPRLRRQALAIVAIITSIVLLTGSRTHPLVIILTIIYLCYRKYRFGLMKILAVGAIGVGIMVVIGLMRSGSIGDTTLADVASYGESDAGAFSYMEDILAINFNYYVLYDYVVKNSILWGENLITCVLSVVPFAQKIFMVITGIPEYKLGSPLFTTRLVLGDDTSLGLGTDIIGDAYLAFGLVGVVLCAIMVGRVVTYLRNRFFLGDIWGAVLYLQFVGGSVYLVRSSALGSLRDYIWCVVVLLIITHGSKKKKGEIVNS